MALTAPAPIRAPADASLASPRAHNPRVWLVVGPRVGDNEQTFALADALGWPYEVKQIEFNRFEVAAQILCGASLAGVDAHRSSRLAPPRGRNSSSARVDTRKLWPAGFGTERHRESHASSISDDHSSAGSAMTSSSPHRSTRRSWARTSCGSRFLSTGSLPRGLRRRFVPGHQDLADCLGPSSRCSWAVPFADSRSIGWRRSVSP